MRELLLYLLLILTLLLVCKIFVRMNQECLVAKPTDTQRKNMVNQVLGNSELFSGSVGLTHAKQNISWLDAVSYEDLRNLSRKNSLNTEQVLKILS